MVCFRYIIVNCDNKYDDDDDDNNNNNTNNNNNKKKRVSKNGSVLVFRLKTRQKPAQLCPICKAVLIIWAQMTRTVPKSLFSLLFLTQGDV